MLTMALFPPYYNLFCFISKNTKPFQQIDVCTWSVIAPMKYCIIIMYLCMHIIGIIKIDPRN